MHWCYCHDRAWGWQVSQILKQWSQHYLLSVALSVKSILSLLLSYFTDQTIPHIGKTQKTFYRFYFITALSFQNSSLESISVLPHCGQICFVFVSAVWVYSYQLACHVNILNTWEKKWGITYCVKEGLALLLAFSVEQNTLFWFALNPFREMSLLLQHMFGVDTADLTSLQRREGHVKCKTCWCEVSTNGRCCSWLFTEPPDQDWACEEDWFYLPFVVWGVLCKWMLTCWCQCLHCTTSHKQGWGNGASCSCVAAQIYHPFPHPACGFCYTHLFHGASLFFHWAHVCMV